MAYNNRNGFWFGTAERAQWIPVPLRGADSSPSAWGVEGTLLNGGGYAFNSWGSHKRYTYEWSSTSSREMAQLMKSYRDGSYGRGLLYFHDPLTYDTNVLPACWADPSMTLDFEAPNLVPGVTPVGSATSGWADNALPARTVTYTMGSGDAGKTSSTHQLFIPIPDGFTLHLGAFYSSTGTGGVYAVPLNDDNSLGAAVKLTALANNATNIVPDTFTGTIKGVYLRLGKSDSSSSSLTVAGLVGRIAPTGLSGAPLTALQSGPWVGGQGHSGCRFAGLPSYVSNGPLGGGQIGFAATFVETGTWESR